jgi:hypothetical protein
MDHSIATASRNILRIKSRRAAHLTYRALQIVAPANPASEIRSILFYPRVETESRLGSILSRLGWYITPGSEADLDIHILTRSGLSLHDAELPECLAEHSAERLSIELHNDRQKIADIAREVDRILLHDAAARTSRITLRNLSKVTILDPEYYSEIEPGNWLRVSEACRVSSEDQSSSNFKRLEERFANTEKAFVFATGPSLDDAYEYEFPDDSLKIICNSIVKDDELLEHIDPDVLTFADPVFHFGPNRYAHTFREDAVKTLREYDCSAVVPARDRSLLTGHHPDLKPQTIGLNTIEEPTPVFPTSDRLEVVGTGNIMTLFMLPVASALADSVYILGADGREENESYFWEHNDSAQYDDELMNSVADAHPSFFRDRIYEDYYDKHVGVLTDMIEFGERRGKEYNTLTHSYVPCLSNRRCDSI